MKLGFSLRFGRRCCRVDVRGFTIKNKFLSSDSAVPIGRSQVFLVSAAKEVPRSV
jgi:hypothetical protein